jgi:OTT_1508-like deaminase
MNQNRILCRLRSSRAKWQCNFKKAKLVRAPILPQVVQLCREKGTLEFPSSFNQELDDLEKYFTSLESMEPVDATSTRGVRPIVGIVQIIHRLWLNQNFRSLFPSGMLGSTLAKLSRYVSAAYFLVEEARRQSVLAMLKVEIVSYEPLPGTAYVPSPEDLQSSLSKLASPVNKSHLYRHLCSQTTTPSTDTELLVSNCFGDLVNAKCAVHAEMQLLFHYEFLNPCLPPRVICSTKKACYLCNLFFMLHGRFTMLATHGRLYEKWTLPKCVRDLKGSKAGTMHAVIERFYNAIVEAIRDALVFSKKRTFASNESLFLRSTIWPAATGILQTPAEAPNVYRTSFPNSDARSQTIPFEPGPTSINCASITPRSISPPTITKETTRTPSVSHAPSDTAVVTTKNPALSYQLDEGTSVTLQIADPTTMVRVETKDVHFTFCCGTDPAMSAEKESSSEGPRQMYATVEHFNAEQRLQPLHSQSSSITRVEVAALVPGVDVVLDQHTEDPATHGFYISHADSVFFVRCWNGRCERKQ